MKAVFARLLRYLKLLIIIFFATSIFAVIFYRFVPPPVTPLMIKRVFEQIWDGKEIKLKKDWVSIDEMSSYLPLAVIASEDQKFLEHNGFDWDAIEKAYERNKKTSKRGKVVGASTISQQVAKNVFLWPARTFIRKGFEVYFTFLIELFWSKERIMEVYLNEIEMGDGIYGVEKASMIYFKIPAKKITMDQAAAIAAILPNPRKYSAKNPGPYVAKRKTWIKRNMRYIGKVSFE